MNNTTPLILTFDLGTQSVRALLIGSDGKIKAKTQKVFEEPYFSHKPGWAEQKPQMYWDAICEVSFELKMKVPEEWSRIIAVTCTTMRDTVVCLDKDNNPLRDIILWLDKRETEDLGPLPLASHLVFSLINKLETIELHRRISVCNWIIKNEPEIWAKTHKYVFLSGWLTSMFCGRLVDSIANMVGHVPFDVKLRGWMKKSDLRRCIFLVEDEKMINLVEPGTEVGAITKAAAKATGIPEGTAFIATGPDKGCETLGLGCLTPSSAALSFGTTATVEIMTDKYIEALPLIPPFPAVLPGAYNPEVEIFRGYWLISWFKKEFCAKEMEEAKHLGVSAEDLLNERLREIPPGSGGLMLQPYFTPGAIMPHARGSIIGFADFHTRLHIYRAIIEGINFSLMEGLRSIEKYGKVKISELYVAGGGSQSKEICQITANMFGLPVYRTQTYEVSSIGSALIGFVSKYVFASYAEAVENMVHIRDEFLPDSKENAVYNELYEKVFSEVFKRLTPLYKEIDDIMS